MFQLQLPQASSSCYAELWKHTGQGRRVVTGRRRFTGNFAEASDIIDTVWDWLGKPIHTYNLAYTPRYSGAHLQPKVPWQELPQDGTIVDHLSDTYLVQLMPVALAEMPVPRFIQRKEEILRGLEGKVDSPRLSLPDGDDFLRAVLAGDYVVDKTACLPVVLDQKWTFFLRPRRFGKSFWVSTLKNFFSGAAQLFQNFNVWNQRITMSARPGANAFIWNPTNPQEHHFPPIPVVRIDFSEFTGVADAAEVNRLLLAYLNQLAAEEGIGHIDSFLQFVRALASHPHNEWGQVVLLIDEYDALLTANLESERHATFEDLSRNFVKTFFTQLKSVDEHILFCFVTGISAFGQTSIWSAGNQFTDYSLDEGLAAMCGFTHDETRTVVQRANIVAPDRFEEFWQVLAHRYDGYRFHTNGDPVPVFNPFLIRRVVEKGRIVDGWAATCSESVFGYIKGKVLPPLPFSLPLSTLEAADESPELASDVKAVKMLFRAGYLTIGEVSGDHIQLVHENMETRVALVEDRLKLVFQTERGRQRLEHLQHLLLSKQFIEFFHEMNRQVFLPIVYKPSVDEAVKEQHFQILVYAYARMCLEGTGVTCHLDIARTVGYADVIFAYPDMMVIVELKALLAEVAHLWENTKWEQANKQERLMNVYQTRATKDYGQTHQKPSLFTPIANSYDAHQKIRVVLVADSKMHRLAFADIRAPAGSGISTRSEILIKGWTEIFGLGCAAADAGLAEEDMAVSA